MTRALPLVCCAATVGILLLIVGRDYPLVGHDFAYFVPRLLDTDLHLRLNGLGVQWYTPSFGGGLPAFANPQHMQYSPIQALLFLTSPWFAIGATIAIATAVGYWSTYMLLLHVVGLAPAASIIGAVGFAANGFFIEHAIVGHVGFLLFPLVATMLYALTRREGRPIENACIIALCAALMLHQGGALILVLCSGTLLLALQVLHVAGRPAINWPSLFGIVARALPLTIGLCASKIVAVQTLMGRFPRELFDAYPIGFGHGLFGLGSQLAGGLTILPILVAGGYLPQRLDDALIWATGAGVHLWEIDAALSPVVTLTLVAGAVYAGLQLKTRGLQRPSTGTALAIAGLVVMTWVAIETTLAKGVLYPFLKSLPVFRSMHVNHRVAAVFILPLTIAAAMLFDRWQQTARRSLVHIAVALAVTAPLFYLTLPDYVHRRTFDVSASARVHERIRAGETFPVLRNDLVTDDRAIGESASSQLVYEPLFGYDNEYFTPKVREGAITLERDGALNLTNASSLLFPELNGVEPFDLIRANDRENLERFAARRQPDWNVPPIFGWLNGIAVVSLAFCLGVLIVSPIRRRRG